MIFSTGEFYNLNLGEPTQVDLTKFDSVTSGCILNVSTYVLTATGMDTQSTLLIPPNGYGEFAIPGGSQQPLQVTPLNFGVNPSGGSSFFMVMLATEGSTFEPLNIGTTFAKVIGDVNNPLYVSNSNSVFLVTNVAQLAELLSQTYPISGGGLTPYMNADSYRSMEIFLLTSSWLGTNPSLTVIVYEYDPTGGQWQLQQFTLTPASPGGQGTYSSSGTGVNKMPFHQFSINWSISGTSPSCDLYIGIFAKS